MKIYFAASIRGGRDDTQVYRALIEFLKTVGEVLTEHLADKNLSTRGEELDADVIYGRDIAWIEESDVVVAEVSTPSLGVGYELRYACEIKKPVLCLYRPRAGNRLSAMIAGNSWFHIREYETIEQVKVAINDYFNIKIV